MSESTFLFQDALVKKGIDRSALPPALETKIKSLIELCSSMSKLDEKDDEAEITRINDEVDELDEAVSLEIANFTPVVEIPVTPTDDIPVTPSDDIPNEGPTSGNAGFIIAGLAAIGIFAAWLMNRPNQ